MSGDTYSQWVQECHLRHVAPVLEAGLEWPLAGWVATCGPGTGQAAWRLYPGSLFLLWIERLGGIIDEPARLFAGALECLHNATLHHDDLLDGHRSRRGEPTLLGTYGTGDALLAGDALFAHGMVLSGRVVHPRAEELRGELVHAWQRVNVGQYMDEPSSWHRFARSPSAARLDHWRQVCREKLALGNVGPSAAALWVGCHRGGADIRELHEDYSLVSQVMNDFGDLRGWAGYHAVAPCRRPESSEASLKPTWPGLAAPGAEPGAVAALALDFVRKAVRKAETRLRALDRIVEVDEVLRDFFSRPLGQLEAVLASGPTSRPT